MDRVTVAALLLAGLSVLVTVVRGAGAAIAVRHAFLLLLFVAVIAFPEVMDAAYRRSPRGRAHGGEGPTPAILLRVVAFGLLMVLVAVHHYTYMAIAEQSH